MPIVLGCFGLLSAPRMFIAFFYLATYPDDAVSQYFVARLDTGKLLLSPGRLGLADEGSDVVVWGWQYSASSTDPEVAAKTYHRRRRR